MMVLRFENRRRASSHYRLSYPAPALVCPGADRACRDYLSPTLGCEAHRCYFDPVECHVRGDDQNDHHSRFRGLCQAQAHMRNPR